MKYKIDYVTEDTKKALFNMTIPILVALVLNMSYSLVDSLWVGNLMGEKAMAVLTSSTAVALLLSCIIAGSTNGIGILLAQAVGANNKERISQMKTTSFIVSIIFIAIVVCLCEIGVTPILNLLNTPKETFDMSYWYLKIYLIGVLATYFYTYFTTVLRCYGNTVFQMFVLVICTILNAIFDPIFMNLFGFDGVAVATVVTQTISLLIMIVYIRKREYFKIRFENFHYDMVKDIVAKGIPSIIQQSIPAFSTMALTTLVSEFGLSAIAAFGIIGKMENILIYPVMALNMGLTTIVSRCVGSRRLDRMNDYVKCGIVYGGSALVILSGIIVLFSKNLSWLFIQNNSVGIIVQEFFYIVGIGYVVHAITTSFLSGLNGMGKTTASMILYIFYFLCVRVPLAYILAYRFNYGLKGVWMAFIISHFVAVISALFLFAIEKRKYVRVNKVCKSFS